MMNTERVYEDLREIWRNNAGLRERLNQSDTAPEAQVPAARSERQAGTPNHQPVTSDRPAAIYLLEASR